MLTRLWNRFTANLDAPLMTIVGLLMACGVAGVFSASSERMASQLANMLVAFTVMWLMAQLPPQKLRNFAVPVYLAGVALLVAVALFGDVSKGARRWLHIGVTRIQPSEVMKIAMPLMLAWYFSRREEVLRWKHFLMAAVLLLIPVALIAKQPDLGTAILVAAAGFYVIFLAGLPWKVMIGLAALVGAIAPIAWNHMHGYQKKRILTLLDPSSDPLGAGYHIIQSTIAVGSGGFFGKGWLKGTQTHLEFIPERHTDFIFAVFSEEFGLLGNTILLGLYTALIMRGLMIASTASTLFSRLLAGAITLIFFTYAFVNMGMVTGILPVVGVPLPFISYGGTALVTLFLGLGILMSIQANRMLLQK